VDAVAMNLPLLVGVIVCGIANFAVLGLCRMAARSDRERTTDGLIQFSNNGADLIDTLTVHPDQRRRVVRLLGELEASGPDHP
jgi:hypothetical protein